MCPNGYLMAQWFATERYISDSNMYTSKIFDELMLAWQTEKVNSFVYSFHYRKKCILHCDERLFFEE